MTQSIKQVIRKRIKFMTIRSFGKEIYNNDLSLDDLIEQQMRLKDDINVFKNLRNQNNQLKRKKRT